LGSGFSTSSTTTGTPAALLKVFTAQSPHADAAAALGWWSLPAYAIGLLLFASYAVLMHRGRRQTVEGIVTGTAFLSSTWRRLL